MKQITGDEEFVTPILLLLIFSMLSVDGVRESVENLTLQRSIMLTKLVVLGANIHETLANASWFLLPGALCISAYVEKQAFLRCTYLLGTVRLILTAPVIDKVGIRSLYIIKPLIL